MASASKDTKKDSKDYKTLDKGVAYKVNKLPKSKVEIEINVSADRFKEARERVYNRLAPETKVSGFRAGKAPRQMIEAKLGARLFEDAINDIVPIATSEVMADAQIRPLDYADYKVKTMEPDMSFAYSATFTVFPEIKLPDFKKIKVEKEEVKVESKEVDKLFDNLKTEIKQAIAARKNKDSDAKSTNENQGDKNEKSAKVKDGDNDKESKEVKAEDIKDSEINWSEELNMDDVKTDADVKKIIKQNLEKRKQTEAEEKYTSEFVKQAIELAEIEAPESLVNQQVNMREQDYKGRIEQLGIKLEDFLKTQQTDLESLKNSWAEEAEFQIATDILFMSVADQYNLKVAAEEVDAEIAKIEDAQAKLEYETEAGRNNIATVLLRQKAMNKLQELSGVKVKKDSKTKSNKSNDSKTKSSK